MVARPSTRLVTVVVMVLVTHASLGSARASHRISIDVRGPLALVEVERPLVFGVEYGRAPSDEVVVDLDLPDGAVMAGAELRGGGRTVRLQAGSAAEASRRYTAATRAATWRSTKAPVDEGVDLRVSVSASLLGEADRAAAWTLRYRYAAPLTCREGRLQLTIPGSLDPSPTDAAVDIRVQLGRTGGAKPPTLEVAGAALRGAGGAVVMAHTSLSQRRAWDLTILGFESLTGSALGTVLAAGTRTETGEGILAVSLCRARQGALSPPATRLLVLIDRSRSVGPGNAAQARELARSLALLLPPSLTFNAVFFDRVAEVLFPVARSATLEALSALDGAVGLGSLRNGTDLPLALRRAVNLAALDQEEGVAPAYWVVITDGALPDQDTPESLGEAVARLPPDRVEMAMLILREVGDDPVSPDARRALAEVPARLGGVLRELSSGSAVGAATAILNDLRGSGDIVNPVVSMTGLPRPSALQPIAVAAGAGGRLLIRTAGPIGSRVTVRGRHAGTPVALSAPVVDLGAGWARALLPRPAPLAWVKTDPVAAALIAPPTALAGGVETLQRGQMEKDVVRRALGYAFLPRARACYVTRKITSAADFQLKGRLRLELHLERGEMMSASVRRSTLGRPDIESCLREAAFAVEVPRALNSDAPVIAALNLVFRPRTESKVKDAGVDDDAIKRLLGPMPPLSDPLELLIEDNAVDPGPGH